MMINPFQCARGSYHTSEPLAHAILALAGHHLDAPLAEEHQQAAICAVRKSLGSSTHKINKMNLLDTIVILFSIEETQSAFGNWTVHLSGAYALLEASGGIEHWINSPRTVAQIGLLIWWDTITSLLSRQACVFPYSYLEAALRHKTDQTWNFFGLCGCPQNLALSAVQLAHLAVANQRTPTSQFSSFDAELVSEIEQSLQTWQHTSPVDAWVNEESMHRDNDEMHCSEAWRYGLLIYIYRVYQWQSGMPVPVQIAHQARLIVDHVFACRDTGYLAKQAIFPLFLAGCEITDQSVRRRISGFCIFWSDKTRYRMMNDVMPLLEDVWLAQETYGLHNVCWTSIIDKWHAFYRTEETIPKTLTFG